MFKSSYMVMFIGLNWSEDVIIKDNKNWLKINLILSGLKGCPAYNVVLSILWHDNSILLIDAVIMVVEDCFLLGHIPIIVYFAQGGFSDFYCCYYTPRTTKLLRDILVSVRPSVSPSVRLSRLPCPLCNIYSSGWILSILATNDHYYERVCRTQWPLTLTYIFKVIWLLLRKSCPLCSVYSSRWILFMFGTNDHYH